MHSALNMQSSIDRQLKEIARKYKAEIAQIDKAKRDHLEVIRILMRIVHDNRPEMIGYLNLLLVYYLFEKEFVLAWVIKSYIYDYDR